MQLVTDTALLQAWDIVKAAEYTCLSGTISFEAVISMLAAVNEAEFDRLQHETSVAIDMLGYVTRCSPASTHNMNALLSNFSASFAESIALSHDVAHAETVWAGFLSTR